MDSDEEYGDLDDTAFLEAATKFDRTNTCSFQPLPRPPKRPKIDGRDERTPSIPPRSRRQHNRRRRPFVDSASESDGVCAPTPATYITQRAFAKPSSPTPYNGSDGAFDPPLPPKVQLPNDRRRSESSGKEHVGQGTEGESSLRKPVMKAKKDRIHTPITAVDLPDVYYTQPPLEDSPPWKTRGAIWSKAALTIGVHRRNATSNQEPNTRVDTMSTMSLADRQSILSRPFPQPPTPPEDLDSFIVAGDVAETQQSPRAIRLLSENTISDKYDLAQELADLPSDAFASSSSSTQDPNDDAVHVLEKHNRLRLLAPQTGLRQTTLFGRGHDPDSNSQINKRYNHVTIQEDQPATHHILDPEAIKTWVYPTNLGITRDYQFNIVARGLFHNLLVALPTGLGKTFIAATIMLNWFRWTVEAQVVFVAPTKPLVAQQVEACFGIAGIPRSQTTMLTGGVSPALRAQEWANKRVFFMTPQTLNNDLKSGIADPKRIVLLVVDEAHKATGSYAYTEVVSLMRRFNPSYRILALTATPGSDVESVQKVIDGLDIARIEIRTENSLDIRQYIHQRRVEKKVFENSDEMQMCMDLYSEALQPLVNKLQGLNAFWTKDPLALTPYGCTQSRQRYMKEVGRGANQGIKMMVNAILTVLGSISQGMELLKYHGIRPFYVKMKDFRDSTAEGKSKYKKEICDSKAFKTLMVRLQTWAANKNFVGHPKLEYLIQVTLEHFSNARVDSGPQDTCSPETRIMVFAHWRDSAEEIVRVLKKHEPMIRPKVFVGQSSAKNSEGMLQSEQLEAIKDFKKGVYNTLVATCIGEEGLDIGEVDLIVCYDSKASPIRMLQRMGRTGRKRQGKVILMQMKGKEENDALKAKDSYEKMQELIADGSKFTFHDDVSRRILPKEVQPIVDNRIVDIPLENSQSDLLPEPRKRGKALKRPPKKFHMPDGVITGFVTAGRMGEEIVHRTHANRVNDFAYPNEEIYAIPSLDTVLLDDEQRFDLERRYQTVFDDEEQPTIGAVDMRKHPARQRVLSRTKHLRSGRVTKDLVRLLERVHAVDQEHMERFYGNDRDVDRAFSPMPDICVGGSYEAGYQIDARDKDEWVSDDPASQPISLRRKSKGPEPRSTTGPGASNLPNRICKSKVSSWTPTRNVGHKNGLETPRMPRFQASELVEEGADSSPPPTDPRMRLASQAIDLGSDDTMGDEEVQDTQAYLLDSDLRDFITEDDEDIDVVESSLPIINPDGFGQGTQAIVKSTRPRQPKKMQKIFSSDPTDNDAIVSSDSEDDTLLRKNLQCIPRKRRSTFERKQGSDGNNEPAVLPRKRTRRIVEDDSEDE